MHARHLLLSSQTVNHIELDGWRKLFMCVCVEIVNVL